MGDGKPCCCVLSGYPSERTKFAEHYGRQGLKLRGEFYTYDEAYQCAEARFRALLHQWKERPS
jgi:hypothetical protein